MPRSPFVEKNDSNTRARTSGVMPTPVSDTKSLTASASGAHPMRTVPPSGIASRALMMRLSNACSSTGAVSGTAGDSVTSTCTVTFSGRMRPSARANDGMTSAGRH